MFVRNVQRINEILLTKECYVLYIAIVAKMLPCKNRSQLSDAMLLFTYEEAQKQTFARTKYTILKYKLF